ncbi:serine acetyltransferase 1, chloroplastic [Nicotiana tabacum]|uniref:serine O-acetyltransferase n=1 Tax=Nicotiana tabacum TaxID=4097 RepID=A0A1S4ADR4_TOBAC|nr:serine acetyltransferase 1, chloroplastic-like [Nicotiana tomentosiformis]XP_016474583.1 PREDICTED: serine acetyltransferase 1, chloroplastic-like [Nicotiana tabacum]
MSTNFLGSPPPLFKNVISPCNKLSTFTIRACLHSCEPKIDDHIYNNYTKYCTPNFPNHVSQTPISEKQPKTNKNHTILDNFAKDDDLWLKMQKEARLDIEQEPLLSNYYKNSILAHDSIESALANHLSMKLSNLSISSETLYDLFMGVLTEDQELIFDVNADLIAVKERDPACISYIHCFLNFKGFLACQAHRIAHKLWSKGRKILALVIQNRVCEVFAVDIHPGARIGRGILLDHATGVVIGETAIIGNNVSILHNVTLGGTGKMCGDRHPKIGDGVLIGAGTCVLGNVRIENGAKIGAGSVVLMEVPARTTAVGNPARLIGGKANPIKLDKIPSLTMDHTSYLSEWSDYVI